MEPGRWRATVLRAACPRPFIQSVPETGYSRWRVRRHEGYGHRSRVAADRVRRRVRRGLVNPHGRGLGVLHVACDVRGEVLDRGRALGAHCERSRVGRQRRSVEPVLRRADGREGIVGGQRDGGVGCAPGVGHVVARHGRICVRQQIPSDLQGVEIDRVAAGGCVLAARPGPRDGVCGVFQTPHTGHLGPPCSRRRVQIHVGRGPTIDAEGRDAVGRRLQGDHLEARALEDEVCRGLGSECLCVAAAREQLIGCGAPRTAVVDV